MSLLKRTGKWISNTARGSIRSAQFELAKVKIDRAVANLDSGTCAMTRLRCEPRIEKWALEMLDASHKDDPKIRESGLKKLTVLMQGPLMSTGANSELANLVALRLLLQAHLPVAYKIEGHEFLDFLPHIERKVYHSLGHSEESIRIAAARLVTAIPAVGIGSSMMVDYAKELMMGDEWKRDGGVLAIEHMFHCESAPELLRLLPDTSRMVRDRALNTLICFIVEQRSNKLGAWFGRTFIEPLSNGADAQEAEQRALSARLLGGTHDYRSATALAAALADPEWIVRHMAEKALLIILDNNPYDEMMMGFHNHMERGAKQWKGSDSEQKPEAELRLDRIKHKIEMKVGNVDKNSPYR